MSTQIRSRISARRLSIRPASLDGSPSVLLEFPDDTFLRPLHVARVDFLEAVAAECNVRIVDKNSEPLADWERELLAGPGSKIMPADAVVVLREEMPEVKVDGDHLIVENASWPTALAHKTADAIRADALANLALAEYLDAHPPVDAEQVDRIATVLADDQTLCSLNVRARALYLAGVRIEAAK